MTTSNANLIGQGKYGSIILLNDDNDLEDGKNKYVIKTTHHEARRILGKIKYYYQVQKVYKSDENSYSKRKQENSIDSEKNAVLDFDRARQTVKHDFIGALKELDILRHENNSEHKDFAEETQKDYNKIMIMREGERHVIKPKGMEGKEDKKGFLSEEFFDGYDLRHKTEKDNTIYGVTTNLLQTIVGVRFIEGVGYVHGDIWPPNMMKRGLRLKLIDFGWARKNVSPGEEWKIAASFASENWNNVIETELGKRRLEPWEVASASFINKVKSKLWESQDSFVEYFKEQVELSLVGMLVMSVMENDKDLQGALVLGFADINTKNSIKKSNIPIETIEEALEKLESNHLQRKKTPHNNEIYIRTKEILNGTISNLKQKETEIGIGMYKDSEGIDEVMDSVMDSKVTNLSKIINRNDKAKDNCGMAY